MSELVWQQAAELLQQGIETADLNVSGEQQQLMIDYLKLLTKWNKAFNLTSITEHREMVIKHLLDSLVVDEWVTGQQILDVGTGAGIPGVPLAVLNPNKQFTLLDSNGKKTRFITQAITELGINNVEVVQSRIEKFKPTTKFDQIICRAYSAIAKFIDQTQGLVHDDIELLAMKGLFPESEIDELPDNMIIKDQMEIKVPFLDEQRHLIVLKPKLS